MQKHGTGGQRAALWSHGSTPAWVLGLELRASSLCDEHIWLDMFSFIYVCVYKHTCPCLYGCTHLRVELRSQLWVSCPLRQALSLNLGSINLVQCQDAPACLCPLSAVVASMQRTPILLSGCWRLLSGPCFELTV